MGHHAKALDGIDKNDVVGDVRPGFRRGGAAHQRGGVDRPLAAGAIRHRIRRAARTTEAAPEILQIPTGGAGLIDDGLYARGLSRY